MDHHPAMASNTGGGGGRGGSNLPRRYKCKYEGCGKAFTKVCAVHRYIQINLVEFIDVYYLFLLERMG